MCFLTCRWHGSCWLRSVLSVYSCNRLKMSRLRTASCRYLRFVSGEPLLRCANCHSIYFESMKSLRTALSITLNFSTLSFIGYQNGSEIQQMSDTNKMCSEIVKMSISAMPTSSLQATASITGALISATVLSFQGTMLDRCGLKRYRDCH